MYKTIEELVTKVDERNSDGTISELIGVSIDKCFIKSVANTNGTDLSKYKIIRRNDFAVSLMQVSRDGKIPIARLEEYEEAIMSPAYPIFRVKDKNIILPEYLEMWFKRPEFDREAAFIAVGGVRGSMPWEEFAKMKLPVPPIEKQQKIVNAYKIVTDRIALKQRINDNLEATAMAIFKAHFVTFERYGGNMPTTWEKATIGDVVSVIRGASPRPIQDYMSQTGMPWVKISDASSSVSKYLFRTAECIIPEGVSSSRTVTEGMMIVSNSASPGLPMIMKITACVHDGWLIIDNYKRVTQEYMYYHFLSERQSLVSSSNGSVFNNLKTDIVKAHPVIIPDEETMKTITQQFCKFNRIIERNAKEINSLIDLQGNLLSQLANC